jgi:translation initiation factor IF-3
MRISRKKRPQKPLIPRYNRNESIRAPEVRLLGEENKNIGVMKTREALKMAKEQELDLIEVNPKANPPVCKILDFTNFKYQKEKEAKKAKAHSHVSDTKGIRLSVRIGDHDMGVRQTQAEKFLDRGDKIKVEVILRGRENAKPSMAFDVIKKFFGRLNESGDRNVKYEQAVAKQGNKVTALIVKT